MSSADQNLAFERVMRPHFDRLYRLAWRLCGNKAEAEDLFQELLIKAYDKLDDILEIESPGPWLARVMYNLFIDEKRRFSRRRMHLVEEGALSGDGLAGLPGDDNPAINHGRAQRAAILEDALAKLSEEHRLVVLLHDAEGYKLIEIEELTGIPVGTVKSRLHRARARLREMLLADGTLSSASSL